MLHHKSDDMTASQLMHVGPGPERTAPAREKEKSVEAAPAGDGPGGATKLDAGKMPVVSFFLNYFPHAILAVTTVSEYGARKYAKGNPEGTGWKKVPDGKRRYTDALGRHLVKEKVEGPYDDSDSGLSHAAQLAWNALARLEIMLEAGEIEDRRGRELPQR